MSDSRTSSTSKPPFVPIDDRSVLTPAAELVSRNPYFHERPRYKLVDLFSGAGGLTHGFIAAGFESVFALEREPDFARTYAENFGAHVRTTAIEDLVAEGVSGLKADIVIGGPPCQGFSNLTGNRRSDPRRTLWKYFLDVVEATEAPCFLIENVPNLVNSPEGAAIQARAERLGFVVNKGVLLASDFGVPQNRRRGFIIGSKLGAVELPTGDGNKVSLRRAFKRGLYPGDRAIPLRPTHRELLRQPATGPDLHIARNPTAKSLQRYRLIPEGGNRFDLQRQAPELTPDCWIRKQSGGTDLFGRLEWDKPAHCTIRTEFFKPEKGRYLHPQADRPITHWEAARLQSFPDDFAWFGTKIRIAIQIGNAVPPLLGRALAEQIHDHLRAHSVRASARPSRQVVRDLVAPRTALSG